MARLIVKSPYIKCGAGQNAGGYLKYIATRERVEIIPDDRPCKMFHSPGYQRTGYGAGFKVFAQCGNIGATASVGFLIQNVTEKYIGTSRHIAREVRVSQLSFRRNPWSRRSQPYA